jgi:ATP-dependent Clp protease protease subunit
MATPRKIYIIEQINEESYLKFSLRMDILERESNKPILVELSSGGGVALDGLAFASRIRLSPCDVTIKAVGLVASAATIILAYGDKRLMTKESWVLVHEDSGKQRGSVSAQEKGVRQLRTFEDQWNGLLAARTKLSMPVWEKIHKQGDTYLTPQDCLKYGLVDKII